MRSPWQRAAGAPCSRLAFYLQKLLGRPAPVLVCLQAAVQEVSQPSGLLPGVLQLRGAPGAYQLSNLEKEETPRSACLLCTPNRSPRPHGRSSTLQWHFPPCHRLGHALPTPHKRTQSQRQSQLVHYAKAPAVPPVSLADQTGSNSTGKSTLCFSEERHQLLQAIWKRDFGRTLQFPRIIT